MILHIFIKISKLFLGAALLCLLATVKVQAAIDTSSLVLVPSDQMSFELSSARYNRRSGEMSYVATVTNLGTEALNGPLFLEITDISDTSVRVVNGDDISTLGSDLFIHDEASLAAGASYSFALVFDSRAFITYTTRLYQSPIDDELAGSLTGFIMQSTGNPLSGATITVRGTDNQAFTTAEGSFVISDLRPGEHHVEIDGTTATGDAGTRYGTLDVLATIVSDTLSSLDQVIILPNLNNPDTAVQVVSASAGLVSGGIDAVEGSIALSSDGADVTVLIDGANAEGSIEISAVPVPLSDLPMTLPDSAGANAADFVSIQPANAAFSPPLNLTLPNTQDLPVGTEVDIYSFDHDVGDWVNRSAETGNRGVVIALSDGSTVIQANGVITKGGWHGPLVPPLFIEEVVGQISDDLNPVEGAFVFTNTGQAGITGADGFFSINVPIVDAESLDISLSITAPLLLGGGRIHVGPLFAADDAMPLDFGLISLSALSTGTLLGAVTNGGLPSTEPIFISGSESRTIIPDATGTFIITDLEVGSYTASTTCIGSTAPTTEDFTITAGNITAIVLACASDGSIVTIKVFIEIDEESEIVVANDTDLKATVTLVDTLGARTVTTNGEGLAIFTGVSGEYDVTAQIDLPLTALAGVGRFATTLHGFDPSESSVGLPIFIDDDSPIVVALPDTSISGTISNIPPIPADYSLVVFFEVEDGCCGGATSLFFSDGATTPSTLEYTIDESSGFGSLGEGDYIVRADIVRQSLLPSGGFVRDFVAAAVHPNIVTTVGGADTPNIDIDFANATTSVSFTNKTIDINDFSPDPFFDELSFDSMVTFAGIGEVDFTAYHEFSEGSASIPSELSLASNEPVGGMVMYEFEIENPMKDVEISTPFNATSLVSLNVEATPIILSPENNQIFTVAEASAMTPRWSLPVGSESDIVVVEFETDTFTPVSTGIPGIDFVSWVHFIPSTETSVSLPPTVATLPMFGPNTEMELHVVSLNFDAPGNPVNTLFTFDFISNLEAIDKLGLTETESYIEFSIVE